MEFKYIYMKLISGGIIGNSNYIGTSLNGWLLILLFLDNYDAKCDAYINAMKEMFKQITQNMSQSLTPKKSPETYDRYWWWMVYVKSAKGLPPLMRTKLIKKSQENQDEIQKNLYEANKWWNDWKFQLHWNKL